MNSYRAVILLAGGLALAATVSAEVIVRSGASDGGKLITTGPTLKPAVSKPDALKWARNGHRLQFRKITVQPASMTVRQARTALRDLPLASPRVHQTPVQTRKTPAGLTAFPVVSPVSQSAK